MDPLKRQIFRDAFAQIFSLILRPCHMAFDLIYFSYQLFPGNIKYPRKKAFGAPLPPASIMVK